MTDEINTTEQLTLFGPEATALMDKLDHLKTLGDRYQRLVNAHDRLVTIMTGKVSNVEVDVVGMRRGSPRHSSNKFDMDKRDIENVLGIMHQRILDDMKEAFEKLQAHKDTI